MPMRSMPSRFLIGAASIAACSLAALGGTPAADARDADFAHQSLTSPVQYRAVALGGEVNITIETNAGAAVELDMTRFTPFTEDARIVAVQADGSERTIDLSGDVHLRGHAAGEPDRVAYIHINDHGTNGFVRGGEHNDTLVISTGPDRRELSVERGSKLRLIPLGESCVLEIDNPDHNPFGLPTGSIDTIPGVVSPASASSPRVAEIAVETDYEFTNDLFSGFTDLAAGYASAVIAASSTIYDRDVNMTFTIPFLRTYETNNDPYGGSDILDFLEDVRQEFLSGSASSVDRTLAHGLSARSLGGGVAYLSVVCSQDFGVGVSANLNGFFPMPVQDNSYSNWDLMVVSHELGHNFGTGHTHDSYSPVIDGCGNGDCSDAQDSTIMSYCHLCSGGISNMDMRLHPRVQDRILDYLSNDAPCDLTVEEDCDADLNGDGAATFPDVSAFLGLFSTFDPAADFNGDGTVSFPDVGAYLASFNAGCP